MTFTVYKASDYEYEEKITINTLEELLAFKDEVGAIIIQNGYPHEENLVIMIYDDYIE